MERQYKVERVQVALVCDECGSEIDSTGVSAEVVDGVKVIPTKCGTCGNETIQTRRYPFTFDRRVQE